MNREFEEELDRLLDGDLSEAERGRVQAKLEADPEAVEWFADRALLHASLRRSMQRRGLTEEAFSGAAAPSAVPPQSGRRPLFPTRATGAVLLAAAAALLAFLFWPSKPEPDPSFATMTSTKAAFWESGDLATAEGSRLGTGTLNLAEGLATLIFDSGAEVVLEAPASLTLVDAMNCSLAYGTAVSDIPDSATGFRIKTPSADVVDYGTRFAVCVFEGTGETHTHVMEGRVQVEDTATQEVVELTTGQRNTVKGKTKSEATALSEGEVQTVAIPASERRSSWTQIEAVKDAYTGHVSKHTSETLLLVKRAIEEGSVNRQAYLGFDLSEHDLTRVEEAGLYLHVAPTGWGLASHVPDATFSVLGMTGDVPAWDESILHGAFPGKPELVPLGSFTIPQGVQSGRFGMQSEALADFIRGQSGTFSLKIVRETVEAKTGGLVHGFASRRHPILPAPTLSVRFRGNQAD